MPLFTTIEINKKTTVYVWKITESLDFLRDVELSKNSLNRLNSMKSTSHQKGFLSIRHLLKHVGISDESLYYNEFGKPLLKDKRHISITHSFDFSAIVISNKQVGIDIEKNRDKITVIKHRFTDFVQNELSEIDFIQQLTHIWAAKESMFKIHPCGGMSFKNDLKIISRNSKTGKGYIDTPELTLNCNLFFLQLDHYSLSVATV